MKNFSLLAVVVGVVGTSSIFAMGCSSSSSSKDDNPGNTSDAGGGTDGGSEGGNGSDGGGGNDGGGGSATSCSTATLYAGNPTYAGTDLPTSGTGIKADPPLQYEDLLFSGNLLYTRQEGEIWVIDTSAANPVETLVVGKNDSTSSFFSYTDGPCSTARFAQIRGLDVLADGSLVVSDQTGNGVLHVKNPTTPATCAVEYWAGNATAHVDDLDPSSPPNVGADEGVGATAKFAAPGPLVADSAGNVYVADSGNHKIRKIANDAAHTVSTLAPLPADGPDSISNFTRIGSKLYATGATGAAAFIISVDTTNGAVANVLTGAGDKFPPLDMNTFPSVSGITNDGTGLIIAGSGYLWYLTTAGAITNIAGIGVLADIPTGYDPAAPHAASALDMLTSQGLATSGALYYVSYRNGSVYFRGHGDGKAAFVERIACP